MTFIEMQTFLLNIPRDPWFKKHGRPNLSDTVKVSLGVAILARTEIFQAIDPIEFFCQALEAEA